MRCSSRAFSLHICGNTVKHFVLPSFNTNPVGYAIIFPDVYDFALMNAVDEALVLSDRGTSLERAVRDWASYKEDSPRIGGIDR